MSRRLPIFFFFFFNDTATTEIYTLSLHDALPIFDIAGSVRSIDLMSHLTPAIMLTVAALSIRWPSSVRMRSEEHTSELQSPCNLVCRLLLEKKKYKASAARITSCRHRHLAGRAVQ